MKSFVDKTSVVEAATIYLGKDLIGRDYKITLPDVVPVTADVSGLMGTVNLPLLNTLEDMELTISKVGVDANAPRLCSPGKKSITAKWVQDKVNSSGEVKPVGCSAKFTCLPKSYMPAADIEVGSASKFDCPMDVSIYQLYVDGKKVFEVNRMTGTLKAWNGKKLVDYSQNFNSLL